MTTITEDLDLPDTGTPNPAMVLVRLAGAQGRPVVGQQVSTGRTIVGETILTRENGGINAAGVWSMDLAPNADITPSGTTWYVERFVPGCADMPPMFLTVPVTGGPFSPYQVEDDPLGTIAPSALEAHRANLSLHGGGVILDVKFLTSALTVTGTGGGLTAAPVSALTITVPDVPRFVHVWAIIPVIQTSGGPTEQSWGIFPTGSYGVFGGLDGDTPPDIDTTNTRKAILHTVLDPLSGGNYTVAATGVGGNLTARTNASTITKARIWAQAA